MRRAVILGVMLLAFSFATPAEACKQCNWHFVWPPEEECPFCDDSWCGWVLCNLMQDEVGNDTCRLQGDGCDDKGVDGWCGPPSYTSLDSTWRLTRVHVVTRTAQRPASVRIGRKG